MAVNLNRYEELFNEFAETIEKLSNGYDLFVQSQQQANDALTIMRSQSQLLQQAATSLRSLVETILSVPESTKQQLDAYLQQLHQAVYVPIEESLHAVEQLKNQLQQAAELSDTQPLLEQLRTYNAQMEVLQRSIMHHIQQQNEQLLPHLKDYLDKTATHLMQELLKNLVTIRDSIIQQYEHRLDIIATKLSTNLGNETRKMLEAAEMVRSNTAHQHEQLFNKIEALATTHTASLEQMQQILAQSNNAIQAIKHQVTALQTPVETIKELFDTSLTVHAERYRDILKQFDKVEKTLERHHDDVIHLANTLDPAIKVLTSIETPIKDTSKFIQVIGKFISTIAERLTKIEQQLWAITDALETLTASTNAIATSVTEKTDDIRHHVLHHKRYLLIGSVAAITAVALLLYALIG